MAHRVYERPQNAEILANIATAQAALGRLEQALASFDAPLEIAPGHVQTLVNRALVLEALGRRNEAVIGYRRALDLAASTDDQARRVALEALARLASVSENGR